MVRIELTATHLVRVVRRKDEDRLKGKEQRKWSGSDLLLSKDYKHILFEISRPIREKHVEEHDFPRVSCVGRHSEHTAHPLHQRVHVLRKAAGSFQSLCVSSP